MAAMFSRALRLLTVGMVCSVYAGHHRASAQVISIPGTTTGSVLQNGHSKTVTQKASATTNGPAEENLLVVGTHLGATATEKIQPVVVITGDQIQQSSSMTMGDVFANIPSLNFSGNTYSNYGGSCINLRNLGQDRTLVLIDGHRAIQGVQGCTDMNAIAPALVKSVAILKDGSSTNYGSDAVAGVINITLDHNFTGTTITSNGGISDHGDAATAAVSATHGFDIQHGRGNITISGSYNFQASMDANQRGWARNGACNDPLKGQTPVCGSIANYGGLYYGINGGAPLSAGFDHGVTPNGSGGFSPYTNADRLSPYDYGQLIARQDLETISETGRYDVNDNLQLYMDGNWTHTSALSQSAPQAVYTPSSTVAGLPTTFVIPAGNPYNPFGEDVTMDRRFPAFGNSYQDFENDQFQVTLGGRGRLPRADAWHYDIYYSYGKSVGNIGEPNHINMANLEQEVGFQQTGGPGSTRGVYNPGVCTGSCVLINPFGSSQSQAARNYATYQFDYPRGYELRDVQATVSNKHLLALPYGPLGIALGVEHRGYDAYHSASTIATQGLDPNTSYSAFAGAYNATEVFGELSVPLLHNLPGVQTLAGEASGRYSNYSNFGNAFTWHAGLFYTPAAGISFRANISTSFRAPGISDLYYGTYTTESSAYIDPCYQATNPVVVSNCARQGVNTKTFSENNNEIRVQTGGNRALQPETARTVVIGTVLQPSFLPGFNATIDFWHTHVSNTIGNPNLQTELDNCYADPKFTSPYCSVYHGRDGAGQLYPVTYTEQNLGQLITSGIDFAGGYSWRINPDNVASFNVDIQDLTAFKQQNLPGTPMVSYLGSFEDPNPKWLGSGVASFTHGRWTFAYIPRFIDGETYVPSSYYADRVYNRFNMVLYHNVQFTYRGPRYTVTGGVRNVGGKDPLAYPLSSYGTQTGAYDIVGRYIFLKVQAHF